jgi:tetratricopeptide (TPR) repeat protein
MDDASLRAAIRERLSKDDLAGAWALLPAAPELAKAGPEIALTWLETARMAPVLSSTELVAAVTTIDAAFPDEVSVGMAAALTLVTALSRRPMDTPATADPLAETARRIAERVANAALADDVRPFAELGLGNALRLESRARDDEASHRFDAAIAARPDDPDFRFDVGLFHKSRGRFAEAHDAFQRAFALGRRDAPLFFNLAVSATALGRGDAAKKAWAHLGIDVQVNEAGMPVATNIPDVELRVPTRGSGHAATGPIPDDAMTFEVVSVAALSPCHGVVQTPTLRDAPVDYGDVVLWDGVPVGRRVVGDRVVPRFALLEILRPGNERRFRFIALEKAPEDTARLAERLPKGSSLFVLDAQVEAVCPRCAAGDALIKHAHLAPEEHRITRGKLIVDADTSLAAVRDALEAAVQKSGSVSLSVPALYDALGDAKRAGREHQAYRGIERMGIQRGLLGAS